MCGLWGHHKLQQAVPCMASCQAATSRHSIVEAVETPHTSQPHAFLLGQRTLLTIPPVGTKRSESEETFVQDPATTAPWVRTRPRGQCPASSFVLPCPMRRLSSKTHRLGACSGSQEGLCPASRASLKPPLSDHGAQGRLGPHLKGLNGLREG